MWVSCSSTEMAIWVWEVFEAFWEVEFSKLHGPTFTLPSEYRKTKTPHSTSVVAHSSVVRFAPRVPRFVCHPYSSRVGLSESALIAYWAWSFSVFCSAPHRLWYLLFLGRPVETPDGRLRWLPTCQSDCRDDCVSRRSVANSGTCSRCCKSETANSSSQQHWLEARAARGTEFSSSVPCFTVGA